MSFSTMKPSFESGGGKVNVYNSFVHSTALTVSSQTYKDKEGMFSICRVLYLRGKTGRNSSEMGKEAAQRSEQGTGRDSGRTAKSER